MVEVAGTLGTGELSILLGGWDLEQKGYMGVDNGSSNLDDHQSLRMS